MSLATRVLLGLVAGLILGLFLAPAESGMAAGVVGWIEPIGGLWVNAIRMTVIPLLVSLLIAGIASAGTHSVAKIGGGALSWFVGLVAVSAVVGWLLAPPLLRMSGAESAQVMDVASGAVATSEVTLPPFRDWFVGLLPSNPVAAAVDGAILPLVLFSVLFGLAAARIDTELREKIEGHNILYRMNVIMKDFHFGAPDDYRCIAENPTADSVMEAAKDVPRSVHPAVWTRDTGEKVLHVSPWMAEGIENDETPEGNALLDAVSHDIFDRAKELSYWHHWKPTDMLIWDNWRVLHVVSGHHPQYQRRMQRTTIKGDYGLGYFEGGASNDNKILERTY